MECATCQFYRSFDKPRKVEVPGLEHITVDGECRRNPPAIFQEKTPDGSIFVPVFPPVSRNQWCGAGKWNEVSLERSFQAWDRVDESVLKGMANRHKEW
jgi:hypothetical protein